VSPLEATLARQLGEASDGGGDGLDDSG